MKAYAKEEFVTQKIGFDLTALKSLIQTIHCMPTNYNIVQQILTCFRNLHVDNENVMYSLPNCRVHELRGEDRVISLEIQVSNSLMCALASLSRTDSLLDNIYCRYLGYMKSKSTKLRLFKDYVVKCLENDGTKLGITREAEINLEAIEDIEKDLSTLSKLSSYLSVKIYYSALIHSQLFEVPLRRGNHHLYTLNELTSLSKRTYSFMCYHDEGKSSSMIFLNFTSHLPMFYHDFTFIYL